MAEYIEREALLKHAHIGMTRITDTEWQQGYWDGVDDMVEYVREEPAADVVEVKHGKWKIVYQNEKATVYECSECNHLTFGTSDYCICGARMEGEGE